MENSIVTPNFTGVLRELPAEPVKEMLSVTVLPDARTLVRINSSSLSLLQTCMRKSFYTLIQGWRPKAGSPPLIFGSAIHKALEVFYGHPSRERSFPRNFEHVAPALAGGGEAPEPHFLYEAIRAFVCEAQPLQALPQSDKRSIPSGIWTLMHYFKTYLHDTYVIHTDERGPFIERDFSVDIYADDEIEIQLFGRIDFALRNEATGEVMIGDHKTTSQMGSDFLNRIKPNHQYTGYVIGAQEVYGIQSDNFIVNGIQVKSIPVTTRGSAPHFTRQITRRSAEDRAEFREVLISLVGWFLECRDQKMWPLGPVDACATWGGCQYLEVCGAPDALRQNILEAKFKREETNA